MHHQFPSWASCHALLQPRVVFSLSVKGVIQPCRYMLSDILAIRCDRDRYYYGRDQLWAVHPSIVEEIVAHVPVAVTELLDGCLWKSSHTDNGVRRVSRLFVASSPRLDVRWCISQREAKAQDVLFYKWCFQFTTCVCVFFLISELRSKNSRSIAIF
jgi:hypothetical protein